ncbi:MAG: hypothetical protein LIP01_07830 [Tannerellaceae bacterium]|nr:hypothetical protein [Tannerellaceae bacterium]
MKRVTTKYMFLLFILLTGLIACSDDEKEETLVFKGSDAFITSFRLEKMISFMKELLKGLRLLQ